MERIVITCPFTGMPFEAIKYADGRIIATNAITGEDMHITYNAPIKRYMFDEKYFTARVCSRCKNAPICSRYRKRVLAFWQSKTV